MLTLRGHQQALDLLDPVKIVVDDPATAEALTPEELAEWIGGGVSASDPVIVSLAKSCGEQCRSYLGTRLVPEEIVCWYDMPSSSGPWWDGVRDGPTWMADGVGGRRNFNLMSAKVNSVTKVAFYGLDDSETLADPAVYQANLNATWPSVVLRHSRSWPSISLRSRDSVAITCEAGYGAPSLDDNSEVPEAIKNGMKALGAYMYEHRGECDVDEAMSKSGATTFWRPYKRTRT